MRKSIKEGGTDDKNCITSLSSARLSDQIDKPNRSILKRASVSPAIIDENYLMQPLLKESDPFGQKKSKRNFGEDNDYRESMASMAFDNDPLNMNQNYIEVPT